jgi:hypothetical protein
VPLEVSAKAPAAANSAAKAMMDFFKMDFPKERWTCGKGLAPSVPSATGCSAGA